MNFVERRMLIARDMPQPDIEKEIVESGGDPAEYMDIGIWRLDEPGMTIDSIPLELDDEGFWTYTEDEVEVMVGEMSASALEEMFGVTIEPGERKILLMETYYSWEQPADE